MMATAHTTALLIMNSNSRNGGDADINEGVTELERSGIAVIQKISNSAEHTAQLIKDYCQKIQLVILGGGDGTISSAAGALYRHQLTLGILPLGTANDLAHSLDIPPNLPDAFRIIIANYRAKINLGVVNDYYFLNAAHIGLGVNVTHELTPEVKKIWGVFSYLKAVFVAFKNHHSFRAVITANGRSHKLRSIQLAVGNGRYYGGGNVIDERSEIDDGVLCLYSLPRSTLWELLSQAPLLRYGMHRQMPTTFTLASTQIEIATRKPKDIIADGELISKTPALFKVIPQALEVIRAAPR